LEQGKGCLESFDALDTTKSKAEESELRELKSEITRTAEKG